MPKAMQELDLLITLSAGSVIAEAMAAGKPVIGTPVGSTAAMIVHGETGYIVPLDPIEGITDKIVELAKDPIQSRHIGQQARKYTEEAFGIERHVRRVEDIYKELLITDFTGK